MGKKRTPQPADHVVTIIHGHEGSNKTKAHPGTLFFGIADRIRFRTVDTGATIFIPKLKFYSVSNPGEVVRSIELNADETSEALVLAPIKERKTRCKKDEKYPYAIHSEKENEFVEAKSSPSMILVDGD